jgi:D-alanyl-D-alanine carboxypeptidase
MLVISKRADDKHTVGKRRLMFMAVCLVAILALTAVWSVYESGHTSASKPLVSSRNNSSKQTPAPAAAPPAFDATKYSTTDPASIWVITNKHHSLNPLNYAPADLTAVGGGQMMRAEAAGALKDLIAGAKSAGLAITPASAYRSYNTQVTVYTNEVKNYGQAVADSESARPGYSEHQTGLAVDIAGGGCSIADCFANTAEGKWAATHAYEYGFILRYPDSKTAITGYRTEAWHFRYVGRDLAAEMHRTGTQTLEEFFKSDAAPTYN